MIVVLDQGKSGGGGEKCLDSGHILKVKSTAFANTLMLRIRERSHDNSRALV